MRSFTNPSSQRMNVLARSLGLGSVVSVSDGEKTPLVLIVVREGVTYALRLGREKRAKELLRTWWRDQAAFSKVIAESLDEDSPTFMTGNG
jgi:hypothetical protein